VLVRLMSCVRRSEPRNPKSVTPDVCGGPNPGTLNPKTNTRIPDTDLRPVATFKGHLRLLSCGGDPELRNPKSLPPDPEPGSGAPITHQQSPNTKHQAPSTKHQSSNTKHQSAITNYQSQNTNHQSPNTNHRSSITKPTCWSAS